ncbi:MAG: M55 family metallopeptidase [Armatimonadota bacterium]
MRIYIMTDMEGISGIRTEQQCQSDHPSYQAGRKLLMGDVNAAIGGAFEGGATDVLVSDGHGGGPHFIIEEMDPRARYERPDGGGNYLPGIDEGFAGCFLVGAHAMAGTENAFLDHTQSSRYWFNYYINGEKAGEIGQVGAIAGHYGVPMLLVTGDRAACGEAETFFPGVKTVAVKEALGRQQARCVHPERSRELIRAAAQEAMGLVGQVQPYKVDLPGTVRLEVCRSDTADGLARKPGTRRLDARTVERDIESALEILSF